MYRLSDGLCRDNTDGLAHLHRLAGRHVGAVTFRADTQSGTAGKNRTDLYFRDLISVLIHTNGNNIVSTLGVIMWFAFTITLPFASQIVSQENRR